MSLRRQSHLGIEFRTNEAVLHLSLLTCSEREFRILDRLAAEGSPIIDVVEIEGTDGTVYTPSLRRV